jgi:hypothetical protein
MGERCMEQSTERSLMKTCPRQLRIQACSVIAKKTGGCNRCQRCFNKVLSKGSECNGVRYCFAKTSKNLFLLWHYGVLCVNWWGEKQ